MCMVSVVSDYGKSIATSTWTTRTFSEYQEILRRLEALDAKLGEPECHDPGKQEWMAEVERRLFTLELRAEKSAKNRG